ncbi:Methionine--tRNA ligase [Candidatus Gugararchaeum adminiculabundum]|nr:Methionine--tRNA ligase [Candidatus Gugararchaeum adminiculabundum]
MNAGRLGQAILILIHLAISHKRKTVIRIAKRKILVTAALPYANGPLHLGHIRSTYLPADIYTRFQELFGNDVVYICASDEHGTPIVAAAEKAKKKPGEFAKGFHDKDEKEFKQLGFRMDIFHRTSSPENRELTQKFFENAKKAGVIYTKDVEQAYCEKDRRFLPDRFVVGTCPYCKSEKQYSDYCDGCGKALASGEILNPKCLVCGTTPVTKTTKHYFFKLSTLSEKLAGWLKGNPKLQKEVVNYVMDWIDKGLNDWDISRDLDWGVPIPREKSLVFYVWFDAPICYVSSTKAWADKHGKKWEDYWKSKDAERVHFIGKDIIYHHFLFWPAMLTVAGENFQLPTAIPTRGYLNLEARKFSKSKNWFVSLEDFLKEFPPDYLRYYETAITPYSVVDADFVWKDFQQKINNELVANVGNFVNRTLVLIKKLNEGKVPRGKIEAKLEDAIRKAKEEIGKDAEGFEFRNGLEKVLALSSEFNKHLSEKEPWKEKDKVKCDECLYSATRGLTAIAVLLWPYLPFTSERIFEMLGIDRKQIRWENVEKELLKPGTQIGEVKPLFEKVTDEKIKAQEAKLVR